MSETSLPAVEGHGVEHGCPGLAGRDGGAAVAAWDEVCAGVGLLGGRQVNEDACWLELPGEREGRVQRVFVSREVIQPSLEVVQVKVAFVQINDVDVEKVVKRFGQLLAGAIGYAPLFDDAGNPIDGLLTLSTSMPLAALDLSNPTPFLMYLGIMAKAADTIEQEFAAPGLGDLL